MLNYICSFGPSGSVGGAACKELLGNKGANLAEMCNIGIPVPPGFIITSDVCRLFYENNRSLPESVLSSIAEAVLELGLQMSRVFGSITKPLVVSVRSGAGVSMPGMMDTILNIGLNDEIVFSSDAGYLYDSYRRFIQMYAKVVLGLDSHHFESILELKKREVGVISDSELGIDHLVCVIEEYKKLLGDYNLVVPQDVNEQLYGAVNAVFDSWMNDRAILYREMHSIIDSVGTAVNVQAMVFGNYNECSGSGVAFTRNPNNGDNCLFGEYLVGAQGEDVVAGVRDPQSIESSLKNSFPDIYAKLLSISHHLERNYGDMQDIEFTIEDGTLWLLQTRNGKCSINAAMKICIDMVNEGLMSKNDALMSIAPNKLIQVLHATAKITKNTKVIARGLPASPGAESGVVVFTIEDAVRISNSGVDVVLVRNETSPEDIAGIRVASAMLTLRGGMTSHAAVVARSMGKTCVCGANKITLFPKEGYFITHDNVRVNYGDKITIDGSGGNVIIGDDVEIVRSFSEYFRIFMGWVNDCGCLLVRANADNTNDTVKAREFYSEGVGLCRTEHMFFAADRVNIVRQMIFAPSDKMVLEKLKVMQKGDFIDIFRSMPGYPITIRLLDPPLHEFLPKDDVAIQKFATHSGIPLGDILSTIEQFKEYNPMLGHRGCRLGISNPDIYAMQARAIFEAASELQKEDITVIPEIMIPFVMVPKELEVIKAMVTEIAKDFNIKYRFGSMIELPSAAFRAGEIAAMCDFISFGTNDLTQTTLGISRDDCALFMDIYKSKEILTQDPFVVLDTESVGELIKIAINRARKVNPGISVCICGEHGGCPESMDFFATAGVDYVSCSPYRVPIAKLAAAQVTVKSDKLKVKCDAVRESDYVLQNITGNV